ncbi:MAG: NAD(P)H-binding protein [Actinomycetota bacterium]
MIVVAGGSGLLGRLIVEDLLARGETIRVVVRDVDRAKALLGPDVEVVAADVRHAKTVRAALDGATVVISAVHGFLGGRGAGPDEIDRLGNANLINSARELDADFVLMSIVGASASSPLDLFRAKYAAEQLLRESGVPWTVVRATAFLETWIQILTQTAGKSGRPLIFGRGEQPIPFVSAHDVAAVVTVAATDAQYRGRILEIGGEPLTMMELARGLQSSRGWSGTARHLPRGLLRTMAVVARPVRPAFARQNRTALAMDVTTLGDLSAPASPLGVPLRTAADALHEPSRR